MLGHAAIKAIGRQSWLEGVGKGLEGVAKTLLRPQQLRDLLHGSWLGHPLHPILTDLTIGAWTMNFFFDLLEQFGDDDYAKASDFCLVTGIVSAGATAASGLAEWQYTEGETRRIGVAHALLNSTALTFFISSLVSRQRGDRGSGRNLAYLGNLAVTASSYLGGDLVYRLKMGVSKAEAEQSRSFTAVLAEDELPHGQLRAVELDGVQVMLAHCDEGIYALSNSCSHMGGPLAEGTLEGCAVTCPWHGSRFDVRTGAVLDSPASVVQPRYEVRVQHQQIQLRRID